MAPHRNWKPATYTSLAPYLVVTNVQKAIDFAQAAFGATELRRFERPDGAILHVEVRIDDSVLMLRGPAEGYPPAKAMVHLFVSDVDRVFEKSTAAGAPRATAARAAR